MTSQPHLSSSFPVSFSVQAQPVHGESSDSPHSTPIKGEPKPSGLCPTLPPHAPAVRAFLSPRAQPLRPPPRSRAPAPPLPRPSPCCIASPCRAPPSRPPPPAPARPALPLRAAPCRASPARLPCGPPGAALAPVPALHVPAPCRNVATRSTALPCVSALPCPPSPCSRGLSCSAAARNRSAAAENA
jgi:hypothetical protein